MKIIKGFTFGLLVGFVAGAATSERHRRDAVERLATVARRRAQPVADAVVDNVGQVADAATEAVTASIDHAGDAVTDRVEPTDGSLSS